MLHGIQLGAITRQRQQLSIDGNLKIASPMPSSFIYNHHNLFFGMALCDVSRKNRHSLAVDLRQD